MCRMEDNSPAIDLTLEQAIDKEDETLGAWGLVDKINIYSSGL